MKLTRRAGQSTENERATQTQPPMTLPSPRVHIELSETAKLPIQLCSALQTVQLHQLPGLEASMIFNERSSRPRRT